MRHTTHLSPAEPVSSAIVNAVADVIDADPLDVPVLQHVLDVDALNALVDSSREPTGTEVTVRFELADCTVVVSSAGTVTATDEDVEGRSPFAPTTAAPHGPLVDRPERPEAGSR